MARPETFPYPALVPTATPQSGPEPAPTVVPAPLGARHPGTRVLVVEDDSTSAAG